MSDLTFYGTIANRSLDMNIKILDFIKDVNDCIIGVEKSIQTIVNLMETEMSVLRYIETCKLSKDFKEFVLNQQNFIYRLITGRSSVLDNLSVHQLEVFYSNYLLKNSNFVESIKTCWLRVSFMVSNNLEDLTKSYIAFSSGKISVSSVIYKRSCSLVPQLISCFLGTPSNSIYDIVQLFRDMSLAAKHGGGIGISLNKLRSSCEKDGLVYSGIQPWIELYSNLSNIRLRDFKKGAVALYLPFYHKDILTFLDSINEDKTNNKCTLSNKIGVYVNDLFIDKVINEEDIYLFNPDDYPDMTNKHGDEFYEKYLNVIANDKNSITMKANELYYRMVKSIKEFGGPYILNLDAMNIMCNQRNDEELIVSNLCTEITERADNGNIACCNLGQIPLHNYIEIGENGEKYIDHQSVSECSRLMVRNLNSVIDKTFYPICEEIKKNENIFDFVDDNTKEKYHFEVQQDKNNITKLAYKMIGIKLEKIIYPDKTNNQELRPIGLGISGLFSLFPIMGIDYTSKESMLKFEEITNKLMACIYFNAVYESCRLAYELRLKDENAYVIDFEELFQFDLIDEYREKIQSSEYLSENYKNLSKKYNTKVRVPDPSEWNQEDLYIGEILVNSWDSLEHACKLYGRLNSLITALMPTATNSLALGGTEAFDPRYRNIFNQVSGNNTIICIDKFLKRDLEEVGWYNNDVINYIERNSGSIKGITDYIKSIHLIIDNDIDSLQRIENTYWTSNEIPNEFIDNIVHILSNYVDQSSSNNLYVSDYEKDAYMTLLKRALQGRKTIIYYDRSSSDVKLVKSDNICINCEA